MLIQNIKKLAIGIGVMILLPLVTHMSTRLIIKEPAYPDYSSYKPNSKEYKDIRINYDFNRKEFEKYYFYIATCIGIAAIISGIILPLPFLGMGFILGGVLCLVVGYFRYWDELNDLIKFVSLLLALLLLVISSFKLFRSNN